MHSLYRAEIIKLSRANINTGILPNAPTAKQTNPWCGDECIISAAFAGGRIVRSMHQTRGCILTLAAAAQATTIAQQLGDPARVLHLTTALTNTLHGEATTTNNPETATTNDLPTTTTNNPATTKAITIAEALSSFPQAIAQSMDIFTPVIPAKNRHTCILLPFLALAEIITTRNNP